MATMNQALFPGFQCPNTTQIPNEVFDTLLPHLSGGELKVLLYICRRTFGFRKDSDRISLTQISKGIITKAGRVLDQGTGLSKRHVITALKTLEKKNIINVSRTVDETGLHEVNTYSLNIRDTESGVGTKSPQGVVKPSSPEVVNTSSPGVVNPSAPTKQREQKKEEQKKDSDDVAVTQALKNFGITQSVTTTLLQRYPAQYIREKVAMAQGLVAAGSCLVSQNPAGWLRKAIEEDYKPPRNTHRPARPSGRKKQERRGVHEEPEMAQTVPTAPVELPTPDSQTELIWQKTVEHLKEVLPTGETETRLTGTTLLTVTDTQALICVQNPNAQAWLERRLYQQISRAIKGVVGKDLDLQFVTTPR
jgi:phage replication O-like protein O